MKGSWSKFVLYAFQNLSERECVIGNLLIWMDVRNPFWGEISYFHFSMIKSSFKPFSKQANQFEYWPLKRQLFTSHGQPIFRFLNLQKPGSHSIFYSSHKNSENKLGEKIDQVFGLKKDGYLLQGAVQSPQKRPIFLRAFSATCKLVVTNNRTIKVTFISLLILSSPSSMWSSCSGKGKNLEIRPIQHLSLNHNTFFFNRNRCKQFQVFQLVPYSIVFSLCP